MFCGLVQLFQYQGSPVQAQYYRDNYHEFANFWSMTKKCINYLLKSCSLTITKVLADIPAELVWSKLLPFHLLQHKVIQTFMFH